MKHNTIALLTVSDLHRSASLLDELRAAVLRHKPDVVALVGDVLHAFDDNEGRVSTEAYADLLSQLPCPEVVFVRGNHEDGAWLNFADAWRRSGRALHALHGEAFAHGPLVVIGCPCLMGDETAYIGDRAPLSALSDEWLPDVMFKIGRGGRTMWLMHEPPANTRLTQAGSLVEGNPDWNEAIKNYLPRLTISGHDHLTPIRSNRWWDLLGRTTCVNVGQTQHGPLHYCIIEAHFKGETKPSLPSWMRLTAYPWNETINLPIGLPPELVGDL